MLYEVITRWGRPDCAQGGGYGFFGCEAADGPALSGPGPPREPVCIGRSVSGSSLSGAGWVGLDPTSGLFAGESHIPLACTPSPIS